MDGYLCTLLVLWWWSLYFIRLVHFFFLVPDCVYGLCYGILSSTVCGLFLFAVHVGFVLVVYTEYFVCWELMFALGWIGDFFVVLLRLNTGLFFGCMAL